jgi:hypothetical protein
MRVKLLAYAAIFIATTGTGVNTDCRFPLHALADEPGLADTFATCRLWAKTRLLSCLDPLGKLLLVCSAKSTPLATCFICITLWVDNLANGAIIGTGNSTGRALFNTKEHIMAKEKNTKREEKKKPAMTQKEKKAAKKSKNESSDFSITDKKK